MAKNKEVPEKVTTSNEQKLTGLVLGTTEPTTKSDKKLAQEIQAIKDSGRIVEIPPDFV